MSTRREMKSDKVLTSRNGKETQQLKSTSSFHIWDWKVKEIGPNTSVITGVIDYDHQHSDFDKH